MSIFDITPAGAFVNAVRVANEKDRMETAHHLAVARPARQTNRRLSLSDLVQLTLFRAVKTAISLRSAVNLRSRTA